MGRVTKKQLAAGVLEAASHVEAARDILNTEDAQRRWKVPGMDHALALIDAEYQRLERGEPTEAEKLRKLLDRAMSFAGLWSDLADGDDFAPEFRKLEKLREDVRALSSKE